MFLVWLCRFKRYTCILYFENEVHKCYWKQTSVIDICALTVNGSQISPYPARFSNLNFQPFEVVSRYQDPQLPSGWKLLIFVKF